MILLRINNCYKTWEEYKRRWKLKKQGINIKQNFHCYYTLIKMLTNVKQIGTVFEIIKKEAPLL
jgi:hypothetical protein